MPISTFLNGRDPTRLRGLAWLSLSDVGVIQHRGGTSDAGGGVTVAWTATGTIDCRIDPLAGASPHLTAGQIDERSTHRVTVAGSAAVNSEDRIAITGHGTYEVTAVHQRTASWLHIFEVIQIS